MANPETLNALLGQMGGMGGQMGGMGGQMGGMPDFGAFGKN